jgi:cell division protease FtsH
MDKQARFNIWFLIAAAFLVLTFQQLWTQWRTVEPIPYSEFKADLGKGVVNDIVVGRDEITGHFKQPQNGKSQFVTTRIDDPGLVDALQKSGVQFSGAAQNTVLRELLSWVFPLGLAFIVWSFLMRRMRGMGGFMTVGKSKAKVYVEKNTRTTFDDVAGVDEAKEELQEVVAFLKDPKRYSSLGARVPKGVLLVGPPGTGKTLLARAVAGEANVPFFSISGPEFVEMFVGVGAARVRDLFEQARGRAPAIIFIDELDALGRARGALPAAGHDERENTLNQLLVEMDGFDPSTGLVLLAATNRPEILDPALLRAGRFDRQILVDRPDKKGRVEILRVHMKRVRLGEDADPEKVAALTTGFTGADLANLVNEAALLATRRRGQAVSLDDFTRAIERIVAGLEKKNRLLNPEERRIVAYHELGHALTALALPGTDQVHKVSIIPRGIGALGYTIQRPTEDRYLMTKEELENKIAVLLGGRAAEQLVFQRLSTGAADDLVKATDIARSMVTRYGMDKELGYVSYETERQLFVEHPGVPQMPAKRYGDHTADRIDASVRAIIHRVFDRTIASLGANRAVLDRCAERLLERETLDEAELRALTEGLRPSAQAAE